MHTVPVKTSSTKFVLAKNVKYEIFTLKYIRYEIRARKKCPVQHTVFLEKRFGRFHNFSLHNCVDESINLILFVLSNNFPFSRTEFVVVR